MYSMKDEEVREIVSELVVNIEKEILGLNSDKIVSDSVKENLSNLLNISRKLYKEGHKATSVEKNNNNRFIQGLVEALVKTNGLSARTTDKRKIISFLFDIDSYARFHGSSVIR